MKKIILIIAIFLVLPSCKLELSRVADAQVVDPPERPIVEFFPGVDRGLLIADGTNLLDYPVSDKNSQFMVIVNQYCTQGGEVKIACIECFDLDAEIPTYGAASRLSVWSRVRCRDGCEVIQPVCDRSFSISSGTRSSSPIAGKWWCAWASIRASRRM